MNKYHFNIKINKSYENAGSKAVDDCKKLLLNNGYEDIELSFIKAPYLFPLNFFKLLCAFTLYFIIIRRQSIIVTQYPLLGINKFFKYVISFLKLKGCKFCCIIHDLESLRCDYDKNKIEREIDSLSYYDAVISHNNVMSNWLRDNGYKGYITEILLFDYLAAPTNGKKCSTNNVTEKVEIAFAGNLGRGNFLPKLTTGNIRFNLNLYGSGLDSNIIEGCKMISWHGSFSPEEIVKKLSGHFGLVWDGDSVEDITGQSGNYMKINTPHKTSLYLVAGLPVITSKKAAIAEFVESSNLGLCVDSISDIPNLLINVNSEEYKRMRDTIVEVGDKLRGGYYLTNALSKIESFLNKKPEAGV